MKLLGFAVLLGLVPAAIAHGKGRSFLRWWLFGAAQFIVALPAALIMAPAEPRQSGLKKCPRCAKLIKCEATICRYCQQPVAAPPGSCPKCGCPPTMPPTPTCRYCGATI